MAFGDDQWSESDDDYPVGYRKPPRHSRFRRGRSGNPRGKPRGTKTSATLLKRALLESVLVKQNGRRTKTTKLRVIVTRIVNQAMRGDYASIRLLLRYAGLDRQLNKASDEKQGLSPEAEQAIRCALTGESYTPEIPGASNNETSLASTDLTAKPRLRQGSHGQAYRVGYGKPPVHTRFQTGRSGNPYGRPRAPRSFRLLTQRLLDEEISIIENGHERILSRLEIIFTQIVNRAAMGDSRFQALLLEYAPAMDAALCRRRRLP